MQLSTHILVAAAAAASVALPAVGFGQAFTADLDPLNGSGVEADVQITVDPSASTIRVQYQATGLEPLTLHPGHIHGLFQGGPQTSGDPPPAADSVSPTIADDTDGDGFIEVVEGLPRYGNILVPLTNVSGVDGDGGTNFPVSDAFGNIDYDVTFDLNDAGNFEDPLNPTLMLDSGDIFPLDFREVVLHGMTVAPGPGAGTPGEVDGTNGYLAVLPVASGAIVPEPVSLSLLGVGGFALLRRRR